MIRNQRGTSAVAWRRRPLPYDTTTWVKEGGRWLACAHTGTPEEKAATGA